MQNQNYTCVITAPSSPQKAFNAINDVSSWWAQNLEGETDRLDSVFTVRFGETFGTFRIIEFIPGQKIVWLTIDSYLNFLQNKMEWLNTSIVWEILPVDNEVQISMEHIGLVPGIECFEDCNKGWNFYIKESLFRLLTMNEGEPGYGIRATVASGPRIYEGILYSKNDVVPALPDGYIFLDVERTRVEQVITFFSVGKFDKRYFDPQALKGSHYMVISNKPVYDDIEPLSDLQSVAEINR